MLEIEPLIWIDGREENPSFSKHPNGDAEFYFHRYKIAVKFSKPSFIGAQTGVWLDGRRLERREYEIRSYHDMKRPGLEILFLQAPFKKMVILPRVLDGKEERAYKNAQFRDLRRLYEKEHGFLWKY